MNPPLPWERLLWSARPLRLPARLRGERYFLTDFRLVRVAPGGDTEIALDDIHEVHRSQTALDRLLGTSTLFVHGRRHAPPIVLSAVRRGAQLAALLDLFAGDATAPRDPETVSAALAWDPAPRATFMRGALVGVVFFIAVFGVAIGLHGNTPAVVFAADDEIAPGGMKRDRDAIVAFMERDVMPWARETLGRLKGGPDRITCDTCHGRGAADRDWSMPAVAALPLPDVRNRGWENYGGDMDAQMRNAIYGYVAEPDNQGKAAYMREIVLPGMARLLHRSAYDFTRSYEFNRSRNALGCYHCHRVK